MITIITGVPGMGKTALLVSMLLKESETGERPLYVMGVNSLLIEHQKVPPIIEWTEQRPDPDDPTLMLDYFTFPPNSILIIDEAQKVYRPRATSAKVPPIVAALETHRHTGIDIWLLTQKPALLDSNVRDLCGRHMHIRNSILGRKIYEWPEYMDVKSTVNLKDATSRFFKPPKESFKYYKSAEIHTKQPRRIHNAFILLAIMVPIVAYQFYKVFNKFDEKINPIEQVVVAEPKTDLKTKLDTMASKDHEPIKTVNYELQKPILSPIVHPFMGFDFTIKGTIKSKKYTATYYELTNGQKTVFITNIELEKLGYSISQPNDCSAFMLFNGAQVVATCESSAINAKNLQIGRSSSEVYPARDDGWDFKNAVGMTSRSSPNNAPAS